jgi:hypothetical protein
LTDQRRQHAPRHHGTSCIDRRDGGRRNGASRRIADGTQDGERQVPVSCNFRDCRAFEIHRRASGGSPKLLLLDRIDYDLLAAEQFVRGTASEQPA